VSKLINSEDNKFEIMSSRDRIMTAIHHKESDKVPIDFGSTAVSGISAIAYHKLKAYLGINSGHTRIYDVLQQLARPEDAILDRFQPDALDIGRTFNVNDADWYDVNVHGIQAQYPAWFKPELNKGYYEIKEDEITIAKMPELGFFFDPMYYPYLEGYPEDFSSLWTDLKKTPWYKCPSAPFDNINQKKFWQKLRENAKTLREKTKKALLIGGGGGLFELGYSLRRMDKFLIDIIRNPAKVEKLLDKILDFNLATLTFVCKYVGDVIDIIWIGDDLGGNNGPFFSPLIFRKLFKPRLSEICDYIKKHSRMKIFFHSCGSIYPFIPDFIECGIDILNPVQINVKNMDPKNLKERFGDDITFWGGGADIRNVISRKTPPEIKKHVTELLEIFSPGGGYIWSTIHNITPEVPPANIVATFEAVQEFNNQK